MYTTYSRNNYKLQVQGKIYDTHYIKTNTPLVFMLACHTLHNISLLELFTCLLLYTYMWAIYG